MNSDFDSKRSVIEEGQSSYYRNEGRLVNPYPMGTQKSNDFERGWIQAQKRDNCSFSNTARPRLHESDSSFQHRYKNMDSGHSTPSFSKQKYNAYAEAKGK